MCARTCQESESNSVCVSICVWQENEKSVRATGVCVCAHQESETGVGVCVCARRESESNWDVCVCVCVCVRVCMHTSNCDVCVRLRATGVCGGVVRTTHRGLKLTLRYFRVGAEIKQLRLSHIFTCFLKLHNMSTIVYCTHVIEVRSHF